MAAQTQKVNHASGGITPLGTITITPGTPQSILKNTELSTIRYALQCRQIGFSVDSTPAGQVFVNYGNFNGGGTGIPDPLATVMILESGSVASLPYGERTTDGMINAGEYYLDGTAACVVSMYLMDATS